MQARRGPFQSSSWTSIICKHVVGIGTVYRTSKPSSSGFCVSINQVSVVSMSGTLDLLRIPGFIVADGLRHCLKAPKTLIGSDAKLSKLSAAPPGSSSTISRVYLQYKVQSEHLGGKDGVPLSHSGVAARPSARPGWMSSYLSRSGTREF